MNKRLFLRSPWLACLIGLAPLVAFGCVSAAERTFVPDGEGLDGSTDGRTNQNDVTTIDSGTDSNVDPDAGDGGDAADSADAGPLYSVGGTVIGLTGTGLVLRLNGTSDRSVPAGGGANVPFVFLQKLAPDDSYSVVVFAQPSSPTQNCQVVGGTGVMGQDNVTSVVVNCATDKFTVGGNISGLEGSITLQNNLADDRLLSNNGSFAFLTPLNDGDDYDVSILSHSALPEQTCVLSQESGTIDGGNITNVGVSCTTNDYPVGGTITGLSGGTLQLTSPNGGTANLNNNNDWQLPTEVKSGDAYNVTVLSEPSTMTCRVTDGVGTVTTAAITNISVVCVPRFALQQYFDSVVAPAIPGTWTTAEVQSFAGSSPSLFVTTSTAGTTLPAPELGATPNAAKIDEYAKASDVALTSPSFTVSSSVSRLTFRHAYTLEASGVNPTVAFDGAVLEISTNGGASWTDIITAGGTWVTGGYDNRTISACCDNPLAGRLAWSSRSTGGTSGWKTTTVNLPLAASASARIRFRLGTDKANSVSPFEGWRIDSVEVRN